MRGQLLFACLLLLNGSCAAGGGDAATSAGGATNEGGAGAGGDSSGPRALAFDEVPEVVAREQVVLRVRATPPGVYRVRFGLPSGSADPLDAALDRSEGATDPDGVAEVVLTAPSVTSEIIVRASIEGSVTAELPVRVKDTGKTSISVQPKPSGVYRNIVTWTATVHPNKSCAGLPGIPPADGPLWGIAPNDAAPTIMNVPALTPLAVTLRSGHYVGGCTSVAELAAGGSHPVEVTVFSRPINLAESRLSVSFGLSEPVTSWQDLLKEAEAAALVAVSGASTGDVDVLLDAMRGAAGDAQQALETARKTEEWDALLTTKLGADRANVLTDTLRAWLAAGRERVRAGEHVLEGAVDAPGPSDAELDLLEFAGLSAERAGFASPARVTWGATSDDQLWLTTDLYFVSSRLATSLAEAAALEANAGVEDASEALSIAIDCEDVAATLSAAGTDETLAFAGCDAACLVQLCKQAVSSVWQRARNATALRPQRLTLNASGLAYVGDVAEVAGVNGTWVGAFEAEGGSSTGGSLKAASFKP